MILLCFLVALLNGVDCTLTILAKRCLVDIQYISNSTTDFTFVSCVAVRDQLKVAYSWNQCTRECCDKSVVYATNLDSYASCKQYVQRQRIKQIILLFSVLLSGIILLFAVPSIIKCWKQRQASNYLSSLYQSVQQQTKWYKSQKAIESVCPQCSAGGNNVKFALCNHALHDNCWLQWKDGKSKCPTCQNGLIRVLNVYCKGCFSYFFITNDEQLSSKQASFFNKLCNSCKQNK